MTSLTRKLSFGRRRPSHAMKPASPHTKTPSPSSSSSRDESEADFPTSGSLEPLFDALHKKHRTRSGSEKRFFEVSDVLGVIFYFHTMSEKERCTPTVWVTFDRL